MSKIITPSIVEIMCHEELNLGLKRYSIMDSYTYHCDDTIAWSFTKDIIYTLSGRVMPTIKEILLYG